MFVLFLSLFLSICTYVERECIGVRVHRVESLFLLNYCQPAQPPPAVSVSPHRRTLRRSEYPCAASVSSSSNCTYLLCCSVRYCCLEFHLIALSHCLLSTSADKPAVSTPPSYLFARTSPPPSPQSPQMSATNSPASPRQVHRK